MYAITRLRAAWNAWNWTVNFRRRGGLYFKRFYDLKHGGSAKAEAAISWRDRHLAQAKTLTLREFNQHKHANNTSGAVRRLMAYIGNQVTVVALTVGTNERRVGRIFR